MNGWFTSALGKHLPAAPCFSPYNGCWHAALLRARLVPVQLCCSSYSSYTLCLLILLVLCSTPAQAVNITGATLVDADLCQFGACEDGYLVQLVAQGALERKNERLRPWAWVEGAGRVLSP